MSDTDPESQRRLHPLSWVFALVDFARQFVVPLAAIVLFNARDDGSLWGLVFVVPLLIAAIWRQVAFRYVFERDSLVIRDGWLFRNVRRIEYRRIENIDTERGVLHRLLNVADVRIESSTAGKAEGRMRVLGLDAVTELRERIFDERARASESSLTSGVSPTATADSVVEPDESEVLLHLPPGELLRYGLIDNRGLLVILALVGVVLQESVIDGVRKYVELHYAQWIGLSLSGAVIVGLIAAVGVTLLIITRLLSIAWAVVTLYDYTLTRRRLDLRLTYGLLTRVALTLRLPRIQAVRQTESLLHRWFDRVAISVDMAGDGFNAEQQGGERNLNTRVRWLAPICNRQAAARIFQAALPVVDPLATPDWRPLAPRARARIFRKTLLMLIVILSVPSFVLLPYWWPLLSLPLAPIAWWRAVTYTNHTRWALTRDALMFRSGWLTRHLHIVPRNRIQAVKISVSPFDRRQRMGTLIVDTAGASSVQGPLRIAYLDFDTASRLAQALYRFDGEELAIPASATR